MKCIRCKGTAAVSLPSHHAGFCAEHFLDFFAREVEHGIESQRLFSKNDRIIVAVSGGKDSLSLMLELHRLGYKATGLFIDLSIPGSSDVAREKVESFCARHSLPLMIKTMADEGLAIPDVKARIDRPICSVCGKIKRYYFNKVALDEGFDAIATGHNLDDEVARLFSNTMRWDVSYLSDQGPLLPAESGFVRKVKPLWRLTEFELANYAFLNGIEHNIRPCPFSTGATFTFYKHLLYQMEEQMPGRKLAFYIDFLKNGRPAFARREREAGPSLAPCLECGMPTSAGTCGVCRLRNRLA